MAFAGVMVGMGQRQIGGDAEGVVVERLVEDEVEKILQLDLQKGRMSDMLASDDCAGIRFLVFCQDSDFKCAVEVGGRPSTVFLCQDRPKTGLTIAP